MSGSSRIDWFQFFCTHQFVRCLTWPRSWTAKPASLNWHSVKQNATYTANALPDPRAVMVKPFNTVIADWAVRTTWRSVQHASITVFNLYSDPIDSDILHSRYTKLWSLFTSDIRAPLNGIWFRRMHITRYNTRISSRSEEKKSQVLKKIHLASNCNFKIMRKL